MDFFPYLAIRPKAEWQDRLYCFVHVHKKYKRGLADNGKIGVCEILARKSFPTLLDAARDYTGVAHIVSVATVT